MSSHAQQKMGEIAATLNKAAARYQHRHGGELPPGMLGVKLNDKALTEKEERDAWHALERRESFAARNGICHTTPATELEEKEDALGIRERSDPFAAMDEEEGRMAVEGEDAVRIWIEANGWLLDFLFAEGPHPAQVMRRLYAWVKKFRPEAIWDMGYRDLAVLLGESHAAMEWRISKILDDYARAKGVNGVKAPWQRTEEACDNYARAQAGNSNRLGGHRSNKHKAKVRKGRTRTRKKA